MHKETTAPQPTNIQLLTEEGGVETPTSNCLELFQ